MNRKVLKIVTSTDIHAKTCFADGLPVAELVNDFTTGLLGKGRGKPGYT